MRARQEAAMWESWRTYFCFALVGAIFILAQVLSGGGPSNQAEGISTDPGDRSFRDAQRSETAGQGGRVWSGDTERLPARPAAGLAKDRVQTD
jgi:hypothetical protein